MLLTRDAILQVQDLPCEIVAVPEWGGDVYVKGLSGKERDSLESTMLQNKGDYNNLTARLAALTICDEQGNRMFSDKDIEALGRKSAAALRRVVEKAQELSAVSQSDVEELTKN